MSKIERVALAALVSTVCAASFLSAEELKKFENAELVDAAEYNDGDSFLVTFRSESGKRTEEVIRLYYVDAPETTRNNKSDKERLLEQVRHFGVPDSDQVLEAGKKAREFVLEQLSQPFTVYTVYASALGRSKKERYYGMIETSDGDDLAMLLIENGLARAKGVARQMPDKTPASESKIFLSDLEIVAGLKRKGIWAETDIDRIAEMRREQREADRKVDEDLKYGIFTTLDEDEPVNLNEATAEELQHIKGIGPEISERIVKGQPYDEIEDVLKIDGIGKTYQERIKRFFFVPAGKNP